MSSTLRKYSIVVLIALCGGIYIGSHTKFFHGLTKSKDTDIREDVQSGSLTSPLLECTELSSEVSDEILYKLKKALQKQIDTAEAAHQITTASIYFRDLSNGPWLGINESEEFFPASLLKIPLAMSFFMRAEDEPSIFTKQLTVATSTRDERIAQPFEPKDELEVGKQYTVRDLIDVMLKESSNEAATMLADVAGREQIRDVYLNLGLKEPTFGADYKIDAHHYASFFRVLYNASYLDRNDSETVLHVLTQTSFDKGIVAGVPSGVTVSHKFGTRDLTEEGKVQLHDCGIVYAAYKPYILCVMTQGTDYAKLADFVQSISSTTYKHVMMDQ